MGFHVKELVDVLGHIIALLESDDETQWKNRMIESRRRLLDSDHSGIDHLLGSYGGMGSFNDLVIGQSIKNGNLVWEEDCKEKNDTLSRLRSRAWELALNIKSKRGV
ncbi:MAG: hypothetical protein JXA20_02835 [Spirochaetes bacterium]|nr:hypothetical protein [Spirochaetota bacterium]